MRIGQKNSFSRTSFLESHTKHALQNGITKSPMGSACALVKKMPFSKGLFSQKISIGTSAFYDFSSFPILSTSKAIFPPTWNCVIHHPMHPPPPPGRAHTLPPLRALIMISTHFISFV